MLDKLKAIADRYFEVERLISSPDAMNDMKLYVLLSKEYKDLSSIIDAYNEYKNVISNINSSKEILKEESETDWKEMYKVFNMGHRMELYVPEEIAEEIIAISKSFNVDAQVIGRVANYVGKKLTINSEFGTFIY